MNQDCIFCGQAKLDFDPADGYYRCKKCKFELSQNALESQSMQEQALTLHEQNLQKVVQEARLINDTFIFRTEYLQKSGKQPFITLTPVSPSAQSGP